MSESSAAPTKRASTSKRQSVLNPATQGPKPPTSLSPQAIIADKAILVGTNPIKIGDSAVLHPYSKISSIGGPVSIGDGVIIWERSLIGLEKSEGDTMVETIIGRNSVLETGCSVTGAIIGSGSIIESGAKVGMGAKLGNFCKVASYVIISDGVTLPDYTIVFGDGLYRIDTTAQNDQLIEEIREVGHQKQLRGFRQLIPTNLAKWQ